MTRSKVEKKQFSFYTSSDDLKKYQEIFPNTLTLFLSRCIKAALSDKELFNRIFWNY